MNITTATAAAHDILTEAAQGDSIVWHNVGFCSEVVYVLDRSKKAEVRALAAAVKDGMALYFEARNGHFRPTPVEGTARAERVAAQRADMRATR